MIRISRSLQAMLIRASFGGMPCDVDMLKRYANLW